ncbi:MAG: hypothetical protein AB7T37_14565 [Dehalococcoidia bacterium]
MTVDTDLTIDFEGFTPGADVLGATQANFSVDRPGIHAKELSVLLNNPAAAYLAEALGRENTTAFREEAARIAGGAWVRRLLDAGHRPESIIFLSRATLAGAPDFVESLKPLFA